MNILTYLLTYSFPCQDISGAGLGKGFAKGSGARSGMLWEVERILNECYELNCLPQCLVMENVPLIHSKENYPHLLEWIKALEKLGYQSYWQDLNAFDYGVPQNRNRTFMVSILGDYNYTFPKKTGLELRLKDLLEETVDEKYYLSESMIEYITANNEKWTGNNGQALVNKTIASTLNTGEGHRRCDASNYIGDDLPENTDIKLLVKEATKKGYSKNQGSMIITLGKYIKGGFSAGQVVDKNGIAPTFMEHHGHIMAIVEEPHYSDYSMKKIQGNIVTEDVCGTITASAMQSVTHNNCHLVFEDTPKLIGGIGEKKSNGDSQFYQQDRVYDGEGIADCHPVNLPSGSYMYQLNDLRIRKLTPRECLKLMGLKNEDIVNISKNQSDSSLYHLAGDSIVTTCLMAIFGELLGIDWKSKINEVIKDLCYTNIN
jgi:DNA (cytosine-5)-methyltransferase 1